MGKLRTPESWEKYRRPTAEWQANRCRLPAPVEQTTIIQVVLAYPKHARAYHHHNRCELGCITQALKALVALYIDAPAAKVRPPGHETVGEAMIGRG